jgi:glutaredoxin-like protein
MALLSNKDTKFLTQHLQENLEKPVKLILFTQTIACQFCPETEAVLREVVALSNKISIEVCDFALDKEAIATYNIDKIPATVVMSDVDYGVRFYGIPSGYEFTSLIETIVDVSRGKTSLSPKTLEALATLTQPVHIQVYVTPTCPYCPAAVRLAHSLAIASPLVRSEMVESIEFPHLAQKYEVKGVPRVVINETTFIEGAAPEPLFLARLLQAAGLLTQQQVDEQFADLLKKPSPTSKSI